MAESIKISELDELVSGSVLGTTKVPVVDGGATKYAQASSIKAFVNSDVATDAELAAQISAVNSTINGLTTANISENASFLYYTDARVLNRLNTLNVVSGSGTILTVTDGGDSTVNPVDTITFTNATVFNAGAGGVNVTVDIPATLSVIDTVGPTVVNNVDQITFDGATVTNNGSGDITVTIAAAPSTDISFLNSFTGSIRDEINGIEAFTSSFSTQFSTLSSSVEGRITILEDAEITLPDGLLSSSQQISDLGFITEAGGTTSVGTVSSSQQIVELGFVTTSSLATEANYHIISQSVIATDPIDSNLLLSSVYIDKSKTITFLQFSQSLDSRFGVGGGSDYISNVVFADNRLTFTGVGSAFNDFVQFPNGLVSSSGQIFDFGYLRDIDLTPEYIATTLPNGIISSSAQLSDTADGLVSSSAQIVLLNTVSGGFDTSHVIENENFKYYTDARVQTVIDGLGLVSSSVTLPSGSVSSSSQIDYSLVYNKVEFYTGSSNLTITSGSAAYGNPWVSFEVLAPSNTDFSTLVTDISDNLFNKNLISGSAQIADLGFTDVGPLNDWTGSTGGFGIYSSSAAIRIDNLSNLAITSSQQVDYNFLQNVPTFSPGDGILISQSLENEITITSDSTTTWDNITFKPNDLVSSSQQIEDYYTFALTGSDGVGGNTFYGDQIITGSISANGSISSNAGLDTTTLDVSGIATFQSNSIFEQNFEVAGTSQFKGRVYNSVGGFISNPTTASLDFSTGNFFQIALDPSVTTHISASNVVTGQVVTVLIQTDTAADTTFSQNIKQPSGSFYTTSKVPGGFDIITFTTFDSGVYLTSVKNNFV